MLEFKVYIEDVNATAFFVADFGEPGGEATITSPSGKTTTLSGFKLSEDVRVWPNGVEARGMGVDVPYTDEEGDHVLTVTQTDARGEPQVDSYLIHVLHDPERYTPPAQEV